MNCIGREAGSGSIELRPATLDDEAFLEDVYFATQRWILEQLFGWRGDDFEKKRFRENHDLGRAQVIVVDGAPVGWVVSNSTADAIEIGGIYILNEYQRRGTGTEIIADFIRRADSLDVPIRLSTAKINPAKSLYERLGFKIVDESERKIFMERPASVIGR
jgi:ribosomal protein S18 acetylase RimI-like enzyme